MSHTSITRRSAFFLAQVIQSTASRLTYLSLYRCNIGSFELTMIARALVWEMREYVSERKPKYCYVEARDELGEKRKIVQEEIKQRYRLFYNRPNPESELARLDYPERSTTISCSIL